VTLTLEIMEPVADAGRRPPSVYQASLKFVGLPIWKIWHRMCVSINRPGTVTLTFDLEIGVRVASKMANLPPRFGHARPLGY